MAPGNDSASRASRWRRVNDLFHASLEREEPARRPFLLEATHGDLDLLREVETLLASHQRNGAFLEEPAWAVAADVLVASSPSLVGSRVGSYAVLRELGRGGMGVVYAAEDTRLRRIVALKAIAPEGAGDPARRERLMREARAAAALSHPLIATVFALEEIDDELFIAFEYVVGETLREELRNGPLTSDRLISTLLDVAAALVVAHDRGVVHRDLKPENIIRQSNGHIKILDFGIARMSGAVETSSATRLTHRGVALGTVPYMAPEQLAGGHVDARSDVFAFGVLAWELATGTLPFGPAPTAGPVREPGVEAVSSSLAWLDSIAKRCMRSMPDERYQSSAALLADLRALAAGVTQPPPARGGWCSLSTKAGAALLVAAVAAFNWVETTSESHLATTTGLGLALRQELAQCMLWLERSVSFERHDLTGMLAVYGYSAAYFFLMPLLVIAAMAGFARRADARPFRVLCLALAIDYGISLPFYLFYPVPERWAHPESGAVLLSDLWTTRLIETLRPISGIDNSFPSFHVSAIVIVIVMAYLYRARYRTSTIPLGLIVVTSAFVLGIHWLADIAAGVAVGILSVWLAVITDKALSPPAQARPRSRARGFPAQA